MKSFGLWYEKDKEFNEENETQLCNSSPNSNKKDLRFDLHVNFWSLEDIKTKDKIKNPFMDIGVRIKNYQCVKKVYLYCPCLLDEKDIIDLSSKLKDKDNASMVFNTDCEVSSKDIYTSIRLDDGEKLLLFPLEDVVGGIYNFEKCADGVKLTFDISQYKTYVNSQTDETINDIYIRIRINSFKFKNKIYFDSEPLNKSIESSFSGTRVIDFRINEKRDIPPLVRSEVVIQRQEWVKFKKVHFLVMEPSSFEVISFAEETITCRELEEHSWDDYLGTSIESEAGRVLAYHWKTREESENFSCLVKVNYSKTTKSKVIFYISLIVFGSGLWCSFAASYGYEVIKGKYHPLWFVLLPPVLVFLGAFIKTKIRKHIEKRRNKRYNN